MPYAGERPLVAIGAPAPAGRAALGERLAATPRLCCAALCKALDAADLEAATACFSPGACLVSEDGTLAQGQAAVRERLGELIARGARVRIELRGVLVAGEVALAHERWQIASGKGLDAGAAAAPGPTLVLRLIAGEWKIAIAAPWGTPASEPLVGIWP